jgi:glycosyltransferase involved in cell wall biosynthesis
MLHSKIGGGKDKIWHSTYYTTPEKWSGYSVVTVHDMVFDLFPQFYSGPSFDLFRQRKRFSVQRADAVICVSDTTRRDVLRFYELDADKVHVVPNACSDIFRRLDSTDFPASIQIKQPFLLYIGNRARYKNFDVLAKAYSLWHRRKEVALVLVGGRPVSVGEQQLMEKLAIANQVKVLRDIDDETLCCLYNRALAFVYPSLYEGFGMPLLEAMVCGCPIIASRIPSTIEVAGDCPIYFDPSEEDDLLNALDTALSEGRNSERIQAGLERVKSYSWDKTAAQTLKIYRSVCA